MFPLPSAAGIVGLSDCLESIVPSRTEDKSILLHSGRFILGDEEDGESILGIVPHFEVGDPCRGLRFNVSFVFVLRFTNFLSAISAL